jgi:hypothetical protein
VSHEKHEAKRSVNGTRLFTARYLAEGALTGGEVVPIRVSMRPPLVPVSYELKETARSLVPEPWMVGEWRWLSPIYWGYLDRQGVERIGNELKDISQRHGGKPLALLDHEDLLKGHRSLRVVFAAWWEENTGQVVPELLDDGQILHYSQLHRRTRPKRPKDPREDRRWTDDELLGGPSRTRNSCGGRVGVTGSSPARCPRIHIGTPIAPGGTRRLFCGSFCTCASTVARRFTAAISTPTMSLVGSSIGQWERT